MGRYQRQGQGRQARTHGRTRYEHAAGWLRMTGDERGHCSATVLSDRSHQLPEGDEYMQPGLQLEHQAQARGWRGALAPPSGEFCLMRDGSGRASSRGPDAGSRSTTCARNRVQSGLWRHAAPPRLARQCSNTMAATVARPRPTAAARYGRLVGAARARHGCVIIDEKTDPRRKTGPGWEYVVQQAPIGGKFVAACHIRARSPRFEVVRPAPERWSASASRLVQRSQHHRSKRRAGIRCNGESFSRGRAGRTREPCEA